MIVIGLGANLPDSKGRPAIETLRAAISSLRVATWLDVIAVSRLWETAPVPISDQPWYVNAVLAAKSELSPVELLGNLHDLENAFGRVRRERWEARILDLDLLAVDDEVTGADQLSELVLPHPRMSERAFVLQPLAEVAPDWRHPVSGEGIAALIARLDPAQVCRPLPD
ncbi:2-amino-4-hydroxy-6-hydroxymethyldihydropteridine diphosphokinase [Zavarzinia aquatilis]|uniref:2-amino-4-hydroxy-6-hydroxymethyldihydropteridine pyrophosphokinase n=1 Tax=Zavarzinia aquatilis TaxID=2211142 RepID=A0A317E5G0_9PROT|nr:2-amino-4-hydroxy-6-hydroxymethyldihydropteridine diphosphokinase [Zavarzinia aquatilis]PWR21410.1 2-amino-4-hydroxy-6-hydroxymethyldihydropteridine diphosphokinase [Zavarzinia aquatilis]